MHHLHHVTLAALLWLSSSAAHAHAPVEIERILSYAPELLLETNRGIIAGSVETREFTLVCAESLNLGLNGNYRLVQPSPGRWLLASEVGLFVSADRGCSWTSLLSDEIVDMISDGDRVIIASSNELRASDDAGRTFRTLTTLNAGETFVSIMNANDTLFATAFIGTQPTPSAHFMLRSRGGTWERFPIILEATERNLTLLAVNDQSLIARASARKPALGERALRSDDGGASFTSFSTLRVMSAATLTPTGPVLSGVDGVFDSAHVGQSAWISALDSYDGALVACGYYDGIELPRNGIGLYRGDTFENWFSFSEVTLASCVAAKCGAPFRDFMLENQAFERPVIKAVPSVDAGAHDAPAGVEAAPIDAASSTSADAATVATTPDPSTPATRNHDDGCALNANGVNAWWWLTLLSRVGRRRRRVRVCTRC